MRARWLLLAGLVACGDPGHPDENVEYRDGLGDGEADSGERGNIIRRRGSHRESFMDAY